LRALAIERPNQVWWADITYMPIGCAPGREIFPYLLRALAIERPNQVWWADITYMPIGCGYLYLVAVIDLASRAVLAWRLSDVSFCVSALEEALARFGRPEILNTDQGSQSTSAAFTTILAAAGIRVSMDGRGRWMDNVFTERLWRSLKHEDLYLKGYADGREAHTGIASWFPRRPHQALESRAPMAAWRDGLVLDTAVDMTLRLDNARALPTCPQPQQKAADSGLISSGERSGPPIQLTICSEWSQEWGPLHGSAARRRDFHFEHFPWEVSRCHVAPCNARRHLVISWANW
jgi:putative transposase